MQVLRVRWRVTWSELAAQWVTFSVLSALVFAGYATFIVTMTAVNAGGLPNYYRSFAAVEAVVETLTLTMSASARYELLAEQPLLEFGRQDPTMGTLEGVYTLSLHSALNLVLMSALIALYCLLVASALRRHGVTSATLGGFLVGGSGSAMSVLTAGAASVACCGGTGASVALSLLGVGAGAGLMLAEHDRVFGAIGIVLMLVNLWITAGWLVPRQRIVATPAIAGARSLAQKTSA
jgi:hypothetical protein